MFRRLGIEAAIECLLVAVVAMVTNCLCNGKGPVDTELELIHFIELGRSVRIDWNGFLTTRASNSDDDVRGGFVAVILLEVRPSETSFAEQGAK